MYSSEAFQTMLINGASKTVAVTVKPFSFFVLYFWRISALHCHVLGTTAAVFTKRNCNIQLNKSNGK